MRPHATAALAAFLLSACAKSPDQRWLGYIEGETALIAPPQSGWITSIEVARGAEKVYVDMPLFTLDATRELAARDNALASIAAAQAQGGQATAQIAQARAEQAQVAADIERTQREFERQRELVRTGASPRRDLETAEAAYNSARARANQTVALQSQAAAAVRQAEAQQRAGEASLMTAEFNLSERTVKSLVAGRVEDVYFRQGEYASAGAPVVAVLPPDNVFVRFFVPETAVAALTPGDTVRIGCDGCPPDLTGTIRFIAAQSEFTPPVIYSVGNRERLVFKAEARVETGLPLRPGLPVEVWRADGPSP